MKYKPQFAKGDRVGYSARFLHNIGADYDTASARGTFLRWRCDKERTHCYVRWDDEEERLADWEDDLEYVAIVRERGHLVAATNIAKVATVAFCDPHAYSGSEE